MKVALLFLSYTRLTTPFATYDVVALKSCALINLKVLKMRDIELYDPGQAKMSNMCHILYTIQYTVQYIVKPL
jgi:hypothetical protein